MKIQTAFGRIASGTNERLLGPALVTVRIGVGAILFSFGQFLWMASHGGILPANLPPAPVINAIVGHGSASALIAVAFMIVGVAYTLGLLLKPAGLLLIVVLGVLDIAILPLSTVKIILPNEVFLVGMGLLGFSGGLGNAFGLNGVILRNIAHPGAVARFLFS